MNAIGIICEYNPFHLGHARMLEGLRRQYDAPLVCAMSGNFVQRGDAAVAHKHARAEMAVRCGADLVLELPTPWAMASAESFARGAVGLLAATALEYVTGAAMEALFKVRYWDYSKQPFNLNGYICLTSSLAWGAFSILLVRFLHPPVEDLVLRLPAFLVDPLAFLLTIAVTVDAVRSFQAAMDLREVLTRLTEENEDLRRLAKRVEVISAFAEEDLRRFRERTEVERLLRQERWEDPRRQIQEAYAKGARRRQAQLEESLRRRTDAKLTALANIQEALEAYRDRLAAARDVTEESLEARRAEVQQLLDRLRDREASIRARTARRYRQSLRILRGNPSASAKAFAEALESLRKLGDRREGEDGE